MNVSYSSSRHNWRSMFTGIWIVAILLGSVGIVSPAKASLPTPASSYQHLDVSSQSSAVPWSFGVIGDTQWTKEANGDDGYNPNTVAANIIKQVDQQFVNAGVKLVVAVGDTVDWNSKVNIDTRALYAQDLYNAGIGFYPLCGNHEAAEDPTYLDSGPEFRYAFPQIGTLVNNNTPLSITTAIITATDMISNPPAVRAGVPFTVGTNFSEPIAVNTANKSVSYAFQYGNATFMLLDQFDVTGDYYNSTIPDQQAWISSTLASRPANTHAFVFAHKNLLGGNHKDNLFGGPITTTDPGDGYGVITTTLTPSQLITLTAMQAAENAFIASMQANAVDFFVSGHDHHHYISQVTSPDGNSRMHQLIAQSDSSKFYTPGLPVSANDTPIQQDLKRVGYYIFTVDGPRVTIDYYGDTTGGGYFGLNGGLFHFVKMASTCYSLNGKEKLVPQGGSYAMSDDTALAATLEAGFLGTTMSIITGTNISTSTTNYAKAIVNDVTTGWLAADPSRASDTLRLSGMSRTLGSANTDTYVLLMSYNTSRVSSALVQSGAFALLAKTAGNRWVNAATQNIPVGTGVVTPTFVLGPWNSSYALGTYGVDTSVHSAWAVLNYNGDFVVGISTQIFLPVIVK